MTDRRPEYARSPFGETWTWWRARPGFKGPHTIPADRFDRLYGALDGLPGLASVSYRCLGSSWNKGAYTIGIGFRTPDDAVRAAGLDPAGVA